MIGAILGDMVGSRFEFKTGPNPKNFKLFSNDCSFTDDTIQMVAITQALLEIPKISSKEIYKSNIKLKKDRSFIFLSFYLSLLSLFSLL